MQKGKINVQTENIFPVIKKFLYSDHEIFLRELISNAEDATEKMKALVRGGKSDVELGDLTIKIVLDSKGKTIKIIDSGIGMTAEEIEKYINQIAFSSAEEFVEKFKDIDGTNIIGHFGLGFYSAFMVSEKVEIKSKSYKKGPGTKAVRWECDGSPEYLIEDSDKKNRGTEVILHVSEESKEFLDEQRILGILNKYCKFLPVEIEFGEESKWVDDDEKKDKDGKAEKKEIKIPRIINNTKPLWKKSPTELKDEDYINFYRELYPMQFDEPLFWIHLNVDYPFNLTGILYFPKIKKNIEIQKDKIQLYSNQVFITDDVKDIVPEFLTLLHGVIDSPDIPLNVSRSYLQSDSNVKKISNHIAKKVADKLEDNFKNDRESFEKKWNDIKVFIEYGMLSDEKFYEKAEKFTLFRNLDEKYFTIEEYKEKIKELQTDKDGKLIALYSNDLDAQYSYIETAINRNYDVLLMDGILDSHFINQLEQKLEKFSFSRVDADTIDKLIKKDEQIPSKISEDEQNKIKSVFEKSLDSKSYSVVFESMNEDEQAVQINQPEFMRRMKDMQAMGGGGGMSFYGELPDQYNLVVNSNHALVYQLVNDNDEEHKEKIVKQLIDLAMLSQNLLKGKDLAEFIKRSVEIIKPEK
ncbi:MAG: molecular chaperone HtpG [Bacteroidetes bacterium CG2_30_33_31]|nr:MAG: molecular chaperone HtpG [Bacteroidetes bacterium CG2_30_33_31]